MPYLVRATYSLLTIYMILVLLRWLGPWLHIDLTHGRMRWASKLTDPLIDRVRKALPPMGPIDFGPVLSVLLLWFIRSLSVWAMTRPGF